ncbi:unnamed protein product [Cuscuta epithymum]|uniref:Cytochrome P450 n=1 Tax=Cuscuta epithymum TaxID=186058 RepID=A0AAV0F9Z4_9ASTE|nr:unnamed protein product [Cuscuta epithymum]
MFFAISSFDANTIPLLTMNHLLFLCLPMIFVAAHVFSRFLIHRLRNLPPTPFPALPLVGHLYLVRKQPLHKALYDVSKRYGRVLFLRFGRRPILLVSSPSAAEECFTKNDIVFANRPRLLAGKYLGYNFTSLPFLSYGERWRNLRRISAVEVLSSYRIQQLAEIRAEEVTDLIRNLFRLSTCDRMVELKPALHDFTFNVMSRMIFGKKYYGDNAGNSEAGKLFQEISKSQIRVIPKANVLDFLPFMRWFGLGGVEKELMSIFEKRDKFMQAVIDEHRGMMATNGCDRSSSSHPTNKTVLDVLLELQISEPELYTDQTIRNLLLVLLQAGSDTTTVTLEWAFSYLLDNPHVLTKAKSDITQNIGNNRVVKESDLDSIPYIRCIVNETLRMHPAAPLLLPHFSSEDSTVAGFHVPQETILVVNAWGIHRDPTVWEEPEVFNPDRFIGGGWKSGCKFIPFGSGRRRCPGENLALRVLDLAVASLLQCFEWEKVDVLKTTESEGNGGFTVSAMTHPLRVKCFPLPVVTNLIS